MPIFTLKDELALEFNASGFLVGMECSGVYMPQKSSLALHASASSHCQNMHKSLPTILFYNFNMFYLLF